MSDILSIQQSYLLKVTGIAQQGDFASLLRECLQLHAENLSMRQGIGSREDPSVVQRVLRHAFDAVFVNDSADPARKNVIWGNLNEQAKRVVVAEITRALVDEHIIPPARKS